MGRIAALMAAAVAAHFLFFAPRAAEWDRRDAAARRIAERYRRVIDTIPDLAGAPKAATAEHGTSGDNPS